VTVRLDPEAVRGIVSHMNGDHADALLACVRAFTHHGRADETRMTGIDADGIEVDCTVDGETFPVVIRFERPLGSAADVRPALVAMARAARRRLLDDGADGAR